MTGSPRYSPGQVVAGVVFWGFVAIFALAIMSALLNPGDATADRPVDTQPRSSVVYQNTPGSQTDQYDDYEPDCHGAGPFKWGADC